jgi:DNA mismatch endonuclease (patch repair protein)
MSSPSPRDRARLVAQRRHETAPELAVRGELHRRGLRYRTHFAVLDGTRRTVDIAFTKVRVAVDVRGCWWHGCPIHGSLPRANADWWAAKFAAVRRRDEDTEARLRQAGWRIIVVWEHEDPAVAALRIEAVVRDADLFLHGPRPKPPA